MAKIVYARLGQFAGKNGFAHPRQPTLAKAIGCPLRNLQRYIDELKHHKLIESVQQGQGKPNLYYFLWHPWMDGGDELTEDETEELSNATLTTDTPFMAEPVTPSMADLVTPSMAEPLKGGRESVEEKKETLLSESRDSSPPQLVDNPTNPPKTEDDDRITIDGLVDAWNDICGSEGLPIKTDKGRKNADFRKKVAQRIRENPEAEFWQVVLNESWKSSFVRTFVTMDWLVDNARNAVKVYEGNYREDRKRAHQ